MKKVFICCLAFIMIFSSTVFASQTKAKVDKISENNIKITVNSDINIRVTGYTISKGNNIIVYYIKDNEGMPSDNITVDLNTVVRPYKITLCDSEQSPSYQPFADIKNHDMNEYIRHLYDLGYINGYGEDNTYRPDNFITRAEFITLVVRTLNLTKESSQEIYFNDLNSDNWAYDSIIIASQHGIVEGYLESGQRYVRPDRNISIAEASKIVDEAYKIKNTSILNYDTRFVKHWAKEYIQSLLNDRVISEQDDFYKKGDIDRFAKRGEISMLLSRVLGR